MSPHTRRTRRGNDQSNGFTGIFDENGIKHTTPRSMKKVNYAEIENSYDFVDDPEGTAGNKEATPLKISDHDNTDDDSIMTTRKRKGRSKSYLERDDESFHEDEVEEDEGEGDSDEDEYLDANEEKNWNRRWERQFVVESEEDNTDQEYDKRSRRTSRRRMSSVSPPRKLRSRRTRTYLYNDGNAQESLTIQDELRELQDDSPVKEKRSLRERTKPVDYTIPPPLPEQSNDMSNNKGPFFVPVTSPKGKRGLHSGQSFGPIRRLFPTGGPFGGNDTTAIFGSNTNIYGCDQSLNKFIDSDSSEDDILPLGVKPRNKHSTMKKKKKKTEIADLDPLGVNMDIGFNDVGGLDTYVDQLKEMVSLPLLYPELYQNFNITPPRGVLFHGLPGTGKTLMARALAASCSTEKRKITFFMRKGADILSKWVGEAERQLRLLFEEAKKQQPSIIFFDEIDGLAPVRSSKQEQIHASIVSTLLALMDGMDNRGQVIVIGATNRPDAVDPALRRPGRFDREFYFPLPNLQARAKILQIHTKKWKPPLPDDFINKLASLTKGYGGADLRGLCTEAALISIQRQFPQIYQSSHKLEINPNDVKIKGKDFMMALEKIVPSSSRSAGSIAQPLPPMVEVLLNDQLHEVKRTLDLILPKNLNKLERGASLITHYLEYEDSDDDVISDSFVGFGQAEFLKRIGEARVYKPRLLIHGPKGNGQRYIGPAILHYLDNFNIQTLDLSTLVLDSTKTMESAVVQIFIEAKKRQPAVIFIPNIELWVKTVSNHLILTLVSLLQSLRSDEKVLLLAVADEIVSSEKDFYEQILSLGFDNNFLSIREPSPNQRYQYFKTIGDFLKIKPSTFKEKKRRKKSLPVLKLANIPNDDDLDENGNPLSPEEKLRKELKSYHYQDMKVKNTLKIKLSGLMDLFKSRYKRFRKPPIEDSFLIHLFEPETYQSNPNWQPLYTKEDEMILEIATGKKFFNMDLDIVEERLWNGYYSEPKQFLKDIELIYRDAITYTDRDRVIKASEMFANAQVGVEEISTSEFIQECKATRRREHLRQELFLKDEKSRLEKDHNSEGNHTENKTRGGSPVNDTENISESVNIDRPSQEDKNCMHHNDEGTSTDLLSTESSHFEVHSNSKDYTETISGENIEEIIDNDIPQTDDTIKVFELESEPLIIIDELEIDEVIHQLEKMSKGFTVEKLEECYSAVLEIAWEDRFQWDKRSVLKKISLYLAKYQ